MSRKRQCEIRISSSSMHIDTWKRKSIRDDNISSDHTDLLSVLLSLLPRPMTMTNWREFHNSMRFFIPFHFFSFLLHLHLLYSLFLSLLYFSDSLVLLTLLSHSSDSLVFSSTTLFKFDFILLTFYSFSLCFLLELLSSLSLFLLLCSLKLDSSLLKLISFSSP